MSAIAGQSLGAHASRQLLISPKSPDVTLVRVECARDAFDDAQGPEDSQDVLQAHAAIAAFQPADRVAMYSGSVGELGLRQAAKLAPRRQIVGDLSQRTANLQWD
jgi:hypothetical protein